MKILVLPHKSARRRESDLLDARAPQILPLRSAQGFGSLRSGWQIPCRL